MADFTYTVAVTSQRLVYDSGDWRITIDLAEPAFIIFPKLTGMLVYKSGTNLDNLASLIVAAKADCAARGVAWENT